jgi:hypothetical protein
LAQKAMDIYGLNPDIENCHCEGTEAISPFSMRLPRLRAVTPNWQIVSVKAVTTACTHLVPLLAGLSMTGWEKGFGF